MPNGTARKLGIIISVKPLGFPRKNVVTLKKLCLVSARSTSLVRVLAETSPLALAV